MEVKKSKVLESKNGVIEVYKVIGVDYNTYSFYLDGSCESKGVSNENYEIIRTKLNLQKELDMLEQEYHIKKKLNNTVFILLMKKIPKFSLNINTSDFIQENENQNFDDLSITQNSGKIDILTVKMKEIFPFLEGLSKNYFLIGGTAISLYLGHRESIDYDLFSNGQQLTKKQLQNYLQENNYQVTSDSKGHFLLSNTRCDFGLEGVDITLMDSTITIRPDIQVMIPVENKFDNFPLRVPSLKVLGASKLIAITNRKKNKDYYDLYYILQKYDIETLVEESFKIYGHTNNLLNLVEHLHYSSDPGFLEINETINWKIPLEQVPTQQQLEQFFKKQAKIVETLYYQNSNKYYHFDDRKFDSDESLGELVKSAIRKFFK